MFINRMALPRRTFLKGVGATLALPLLDAMVPALTASGRSVNPALRLGYIYHPMGASLPYWTPKGEGKNFELSPILKGLEPYRQQMVVLSGLNLDQANSMGDGDGDHTRGSGAWLTAVHINKSETDIQAGISADQIAAKYLGKDTPLPSLQVTADPANYGSYCSAGYSCVYMNTISWSAPNMPLPMEGDPRRVFEKLFGEGGTAEEQAMRRRRTSSILDSVTEELNHLQTTLGPGDRHKVTEYMDAIRQIERSIELAEKRRFERAVEVPEAPTSTPEDFAEYCKLLFDLQVLALQGDITRVLAFQMSREENTRSYPNLGVAEPHHPLSHHQNNPDKLANLAKINGFYVQLLTHFLEKLQSTPDGDGSLLDHSMLLYGSGLGDPNPHDHKNLPTLLLGGATGRVQGDRHLISPEGTPLANLLVSMLDKAGVEVERIGDSNGTLASL